MMENETHESTVPLEHAEKLGEALAHIDVMRAAHEGLATGVTGANAAIQDLGSRVEALAAGQAEVLSRLEKLEPKEAVNAEGETLEAGAEGTEAPGEVALDNEAAKPNALGSFHKLFG